MQVPCVNGLLGIQSDLEMAVGFGGKLCGCMNGQVNHLVVVVIIMNQLNIIREDDRYLWCLCPNHNDVNTPNLCFNKTESNGKPKGYGYCYACGYRVDIPPEEVDKISKLKTICRKTVPINWVKLNEQYHMKTFISGKYHELEQQWDVKSLFKYGIGYDNEAHTFPMRNESGAIIGILRRFPDGHKVCIEGSQLGLFLPNMQITSVIVIVEGASDAAVATELGYYGIGLPSASFGHALVRKFLEDWNYYGKVLIVADADEAGKKSALKMKKFLTNKFEYGIIQMEKHGDLREHYLNEGKDETIKLLGG